MPILPGPQKLAKRWRVTLRRPSSHCRAKGSQRFSWSSLSELPLKLVLVRADRTRRLPVATASRLVRKPVRWPPPLQGDRRIGHSGKSARENGAYYVAETAIPRCWVAEGVETPVDSRSGAINSATNQKPDPHKSLYFQYVMMQVVTGIGALRGPKHRSKY